MYDIFALILIILYFITVVLSRLNFSASVSAPSLFLAVIDILFPSLDGSFLAILTLYFETYSETKFLEFLVLSTECMWWSNIVMKSVMFYSSLITKSTSLCFRLSEIHCQDWKGMSSSLIFDISRELICLRSIQYLELIAP